jgi:hypothetical protein
MNERSYIFFIDEHLTNLPFASRQCFAFIIFIGAGHFMNLPWASRHDLADAIPHVDPLMTKTAIAVARERSISTPQKARKEGGSGFFGSSVRNLRPPEP